MIVSDNGQRHITACATEEIKLDGYRIEVVRTGGETTLYSRRQFCKRLKFGFPSSPMATNSPSSTVSAGR